MGCEDRGVDSVESIKEWSGDDLGFVSDVSIDGITPGEEVDDLPRVGRVAIREVLAGAQIHLRKLGLRHADLCRAVDYVLKGVELNEIELPEEPLVPDFPKFSDLNEAADNAS